MSNKVTAVDRVETRYGERVYLDSPFEAKNYIKALPWKEGDGLDESEFDIGEDIPSFDFPEEFATHRGWDTDKKMWFVDAESIETVKDYLESVGFEFESTVDLQQQL